MNLELGLILEGANSDDRDKEANTCRRKYHVV